MQIRRALAFLPTLCAVALVLVPSSEAITESTGTLDSPFNANSFTDGQVNSTIIQPDGKFLVSGSFAKANGTARRCIARYNADGSLDTSFDPGTGLDFAPTGMILQGDGKIIVYGFFSTVNGTARNAGIARLNSDGSLDTAFDPGNVISFDGMDDGAGNATFNGTVEAVVLQPDGKLVVFGRFYYVLTGAGTNVSRNAVARFNSDGSFDASYDPGTGFTSAAGPQTSDVTYVARQNNGANAGKIIVAGSFDHYNGNAATTGYARLNADGTFDATFTANLGSAASPINLAGFFVQNDDRVLVFGNFTAFNGITGNAIIRLAADGTRDPGFSTGIWKDYGDQSQVAAVAQQADGKLVVGGYFHTLGGVAANNLARLNTDGGRDASFDTSVGTGALGFNVSALAVRASDQEIVAGGWFPAYGSVNRNNIALVKIDGSNDAAFAASGVTDGGPEIFSSVVQSDGKVILGGVFTVFNGAPTHNIVRLNLDGTRDSSFGITLGTSRSVRAMVVQPDGKIIIAGQFTAIDGVAKGRVARLNTDGTVDPSFDAGTGPDNICYAVTLDATGNVYVAGDFLNVNGTPRVRVAKLGSTGVLDPTFNSGTGPDVNVFAIAPPSGTAGPVIGGNFVTYNGATAKRLARLDATTGALDPAFTTAGGTGASSLIRAISFQSDGKYLIGGNLTTFNTIPRSRLARLNTDGSLDMTFVGPTINGGTVRALAQQNGKILVGGSFSTPASRILRLSSTGAQDSTFTTGTGPISVPADAYVFNNSSVDTLAVSPDGKLIAGGIFNQYNGIARQEVVRLTDSALRIGTITRLPNLHITLAIYGAPNSTYTLKSSPDPVAANFTTLDTITTDGGGFFLYDDAGAAALSSRFYQVTGPTAATTDGAQFRRPSAPLHR